MRFLRLIALLALAAAPVAAQDTADDKTYLEGWIEDALSGAGRAVTITGFRGALSSNATLERMTIADEDGIWLTMEDAALVWSRSALLKGRLEVTELTAGTIELTRLPEGGKQVTPEDAEATPFALPDLPVSVSIETLSAGAVRLGPDVLGEAATLSVDSSLELAGGAGEVALDIRRTDRNDSITLDAGFDNASRVLQIDLDFDEAAGGLVTRALRIPGQPAVRLQVTGDAPLSDFEAQVALSSDGARRLGGAVRIAALDEAATAGHRFAAELSGDLRPLFTADLHPFFGDSSALSLAGQSLADGRVTVETLRLTSGGMNLTGDLALGPDSWPDRFNLNGRIGGDGRLRLPVSDPAATIDGATISASYDAARGDAWRADIALDGLDRDGLTVTRARVEGTGTITPGPDQKLTADLGFTAQGVAHDDAALARAIGPAPEGRLRLAWQPGSPVDIDLLSVTSGNAELVASGQVDGLTDGFPVTGRATVRSQDLSRFAGLAGRDLDGAGNATVQGSGTLLGGAFDIRLAAATRDLHTDTPRLDPLLRGQSTLDLAARRTETGTFIDSLEIANQAVTATARGRLDAESGALTLDATLADLSLAEPRLSGPARIDTRIGWQAGGDLTVSRLVVEAADAVLSAEGALDTADPDLSATGRLRLTAKNLTRLAALAGRPLAGSLDLSLSGAGELRGSSVEGAVTLDAARFRSGIDQLDRILGGEVTLNTRLAYGDGMPFVETLALTSARLSAAASSAAPGTPVELSARLTDMGLLAPGISGPGRLHGALTFGDAPDDDIGVDLDFSGPGAIAARIRGQVAALGESLALAIDGNAPLALANSFIAPRSVQGPARFNLRLDGPPALSSLSGQISTSGARLALPGLHSAIGGLTGTVALGGGQARPNITGHAGRGGNFRISGPVTLTPPYNAALETTLTRLGVADPELYDTTLDGRVTVTGPLTGGARIGGTIRLGRTELRVPSGGIGAAGAIPGLRHVGEPAAVAATRRRAGLIATAGPRRAGAAFPLDLVIDAPNQIFVRGRGLDAELGGQLRLGGTTADVAASGVFELIRGRMDILTKRLVLTKGLIDLRGALDPYLRFVARTETDDLTIDIILEGLASAPRIMFTSVPDLPQEEILAQLLFGRSFSSMSAFQAAQLVGAAATLSGKRSGGLTDRLRNALGLADFDVTSTDEGATQVSAGAYISDNIYSEISADSEGNNEVNLNLDLSSSVTVKGRATNTGDTGLGIFFEKDY